MLAVIAAVFMFFHVRNDYNNYAGSQLVMAEVINVEDTDNKNVNPPRLIRFREYRRGFQTPHGRKSMPATLGRSGYLTTDTAQTQ